MKTKLLFISVIFLFFISGCSTGVKKDLISGLQVTNNGLTYEEAFLQVDDKKTTSTEFLLGTKINLKVNGVNGYVEKEGKVYIGASLIVTDEDNKEVFNYADLFTDYDETGISPTDAKMVTLTLTTGNPLRFGETYTWKSRIWDKNGKGEINSVVNITLKKTE